MDEDDGNMGRFRLVFDDSRLLDKSLRSQGLRRCWFLLKPGIDTIGDLAADICDRFGLHDRIVLSMGDFVLPSFESTYIITDKDIITVKKKEVKEKDICRTFDGQSPKQDSQIVRMHDLPFNNDLLSVDKSQNDPQGSGSCDKEKMISCTESTAQLDPPDEVHLAKRKRKRSKKLQDSNNDLLSADKSQKDPQGSGSYDKKQMISCTETTVQLDQPGEVGLAKGKRKHSKKPLGSNGQSEENSNDHESGPSKSPDVGKNDVNKKQESPEMIHHSSDGAGDVAPLAVQPTHIRIQPQEDKRKQQADEPRSLLFDGGSSMNPLNKENNLPRTNDNGRCFKIDEAHVGDGVLPLLSPQAIYSIYNVIGPSKQHVHFESLLPLRRLPVKGDILAFRCAKLSSSVYHGILSPQVGKVSSFDYNSLQITLLPVLDYEILLENTNGAIVQQNTRCCKEDESIQIEYSSLVDVRLLKTQGSEAAACRSDSTVACPSDSTAACQSDSAIKNNWEEALVKGNLNGPNVSSAEQSNGWPQWSQNKSASVTSWSKQHNAPFAGRGNGRTNWPPNRSMNSVRPNNNATNRNFNMNNPNWNPNICSESGNASTLTWSYRVAGAPPPCFPRPTINFPPGGKYPASGKQ